MGRITAAQIDRITQVIKNHMGIVEHLTTGLNTPSNDLAKKFQLPSRVANLVSTAYHYGKLGIQYGQNLATMGIDKINKLISNISLTQSQRDSLDQLKMRAQQSINSLTQRIIAGVTTTLINSDLKSWSTIQKVVSSASSQITQQLQEQSENWKSDWHRIAQTEMWDSKLQGEAETILNGMSSDTLVYKRPASNACAKCKQLYLENDGVTPKVFKIADLLSNGTNNGKKQSDWIPTLGIVHPNCMCTLNIKPKNTKFDGSGNLVSDRSIVL